MHLLPILALGTTTLASPLLGIPIGAPRPDGRPYCYQNGRNLKPDYTHYYKAAFGNVFSVAAACRSEPACRYVATNNNATPFGEIIGLLYNVTLDEQQFEALGQDYPNDHFYAIEREGFERCYGLEPEYVLWPVTGPEALRRGEGSTPYPGTFPN